MSILHGWIFWEMALSVCCWKIHCGVQCAHLQWQQYLLPVSCGNHIFVTLCVYLHEWIFWEMASSVTLVYTVRIHYAMATIVVVCVLLLLFHSFIITSYLWFLKIPMSLQQSLIQTCWFIDIFWEMV